MIIAFVPCRSKSSRFPNKATKDIYGISSVERCFLNIKGMKQVDKIVLATSTGNEDDILEKYTLDGEIEVARGPEEDVLERFLPAIRQYQPQHIMRITGDCPLVAYELADILIESHINMGADATFTTSPVALGVVSEIYKTTAILKLRELFSQTNYSEYLIYYFLNNPELFNLNIVTAPQKFIHNWRLTLDEENDLKLLTNIYEYLKVEKRSVAFDEVISFFNEHPGAENINLSNQVKYKDDKKLIEHLKNMTTYKG
jgi:spore coat polysaccharide biosynthesis protein SpsF (cytidylyltransferase family)